MLEGASLERGVCRRRILPQFVWRRLLLDERVPARTYPNVTVLFSGAHHPSLSLRALHCTGAPLWHSSAAARCDLWFGAAAAFGTGRAQRQRAASGRSVSA